MIGNKVRKRALPLALVGGLLGLGACTDVPGPEQFTNLESFASDINMLDFSANLDAEAVRVVVTLYPERLVAREVAVKAPEAARDEERIHARVVGLEETATGWLLPLNIQGLAVAFTSNTRFAARDHDGELDLETFLARIRAALAEGHHPAVVGVRAPPDAPQAPDDPEFVAAKIVLVGEGEGRILALNVDKDNLIRNESPPPDGWIAALNILIDLRITEGLTRIKKERDDIPTTRFEGVVREVDLDNRTFTLENGVVVREVDGTVIKYETGDRHRLPSLEAVARAIREGHKVVAAGVAIVEREDPLTLIAIAVVFEIVPPPVEDFKDVVTAVDLTDSTVTLSEGWTLRITAETEFRFEVAVDVNHSLGSLEDVARAVADGKTVVAAGIGIVEQREPVVLRVLKVAFIVRPPPMESFRGVVKSVNLTDSIVTLQDDVQVRVTEKTEVLFESWDADRLGTLEDVAAALAAGKTVLAAGVGEVESTEPLVIVACKIVFWLAPPDVTAFHGVVRSVDLTARTFTLQSGTVVRIDDNTIIWFANSDQSALRSLGAVAEALENHLTVIAAGVGIVEGTDPLTILARKVAFMAVPPGVQFFEGVITSVNHEARSFVLDGGETIRIVEGTLIVHQDGGQTVGSFEAVAELVASGERVTAHGLGLLETSEPLVLIAITVVFQL
jgi:hypothetical protein